MSKTSSRTVALAVLLVAVVGLATAATMLTPVSNNADGTILNEPGGPTVNLTGNFDAHPDSGGSNSERVQWNTSKGNVSFTSSSSTSVTIAASEIEGPWTNITAVDASNSDLTVSPEDKESATVSGSVSALHYRQASGVGIDDGTVDFVYSASGSGTVTLRNLPASVSFQAATASGKDLGESTTDSSGTATINVQSGTDEKVFLFVNRAPVVDNPSASPQNDGKLGESEANLSIEVADREFATTKGDELTVDWYVDGALRDTTTATSNGTIYTKVPVSEGGTHSWHIEVADNYGESTTSNTFDFQTPSTLYVRPVEDPESTIGSPNNTVSVRFYGSNTVQSREVNNGQINLTGLPVDEEFVVTAQVDGFHDRRIILDSLYQQESIYLLNESTDSVENRFILRDVSGNFEPEATRLYIQREIQNSSGSYYRTVAGDYFGASNAFPVYLEHNQRYRLIVENSGGDRRVLGSFIAAAPGDEPLKIRGIKGDPPEADTYTALVEVNESGPQRHLIFRYMDGTEQTSELDVTVHVRGDPSNVTFQDSASGIVQNYSASIPLANDTAYVINWTGTRDGQAIGGKKPIGGIGLGFEFPLGSEWAGSIGVVFIAFIGALADRRYASHIAMAMIAMGGVLMAMAVVDIWVPLWWAAAAIALGAHLRNSQSRPGI